MSDTIKDAKSTHWVYRLPQPARSFAQLSRLDRPIGYWLLALPGWIGLAFASLSHGFATNDLKWAALILIGAIAMRGAGCTYNDIVDQDLDAKVERTTLRPLPAGTISTKQAWLWLLAQCAVGLIVLLCMPRLAQIISLCALPLVAAYPFMKRITWWPQVWLGMTFNWAVLVAYAAKTGTISPAVLILYAGLIFWTVGYDTIYACQDIEDDAVIGVKSTARKLGSRVKIWVWLFYALSIVLISLGLFNEGDRGDFACGSFILNQLQFGEMPRWQGILAIPVIFFPPGLFTLHLLFWQFGRLFFEKENSSAYLLVFKSNMWAGLLLAFHISAYSFLGAGKISDFYVCQDAHFSQDQQGTFEEYCKKPLSERACPIPLTTP